MEHHLQVTAVQQHDGLCTRRAYLGEGMRTCIMTWTPGNFKRLLLLSSCTPHTTYTQCHHHWSSSIVPVGCRPWTRYPAMADSASRSLSSCLAVSAWLPFAAPIAAAICCCHWPLLRPLLPLLQSTMRLFRRQQGMPSPPRFTAFVFGPQKCCCSRCHS